MTLSSLPRIEQQAPAIEAEINYLQPGPAINRRFVSRGVEVNTGSFGPHRVTVRDGRDLRDQFTLSSHGFALVDAPTAIADFYDTAAVDAVYPGEVEQAVRQITGASHVAVMGWMIRNSGDISGFQKKTEGSYIHHGGVQPPGGEVHIDTEPGRASRIAERVYRQMHPDGPGYHRFIYSSFWRTFSPPPQDCPLALCDGRSVGDNEGLPNVMYVVDEIPQGEAMFAPRDDSVQMAAAVFRHNPEHRWWYFSDMARDEALIFKFHDSDRSGAWRVPHTAFWHPSAANANVRASIECRTIAFFE
jgi:hypothetical protein